MLNWPGSASTSASNVAFSSAAKDFSCAADSSGFCGGFLMLSHLLPGTSGSAVPLVVGRESIGAIDAFAASAASAASAAASAGRLASFVSAATSDMAKRAAWVQYLLQLDAQRCHLPLPVPRAATLSTPRCPCRSRPPHKPRSSELRAPSRGWPLLAEPLALLRRLGPQPTLSPLGASPQVRGRGQSPAASTRALGVWPLGPPARPGQRAGGAHRACSDGKSSGAARQTKQPQGRQG